MNQQPNTQRAVAAVRPSTPPAPSQRYSVEGANDLRSLVTPDTPLDRCPTSLDLALPNHAALAIEAVGVPDLVIGQEGSINVKACHYLIFGDWRTNEATGEMEPILCTALITKDGRIFRTTGVFAPRAVRAAAELFSAAEWAQGITFRITERLTRERRVAHHISVLIDAEDGIGPSA